VNREEWAPIGAELLKFMLNHIVDYPIFVKVRFEIGPQTTHFILACAKKDLGVIIGKQGRMANSIRVVFMAVARKYKQNVAVSIDEDATDEL
jgi:predicted RNA-binding protein YlqC (UPF0109 family)